MTRTILTFIAALAVSSSSAGIAAHDTAQARHDVSRMKLKPTLTKSNGQALQKGLFVHEPSASAYVNSAQVYSFEEGALYRLYAAPELVSDIALEPGEKLISVASGDTARWIIGDTTSGSGKTGRTHILVKPAAEGLNTNLVITTDRRVYLLMLKSASGRAMPAVSWTYPEDALVALRNATERAEAEAPVAQAVLIDRMNFAYTIDGDHADWRPLRVFDDGRQVFIQFPESIAVGEAPPLFVIGEEGKAELVNFRMRGRYYVVDRLFSTAELRLGDKHQKVVRITRTDVGRKRRRG